MVAIPFDEAIVAPSPFRATPAIAVGFVYLAVVLDAWSRRVIGYALGRRIDARPTVTALECAIALRRPLPGCVFHSAGRSTPRRDTAPCSLPRMTGSGLVTLEKVRVVQYGSDSPS